MHARHMMNKIPLFISTLLIILLSISLLIISCGNGRDKYENDYISFTLGKGFTAILTERGYGDLDFGRVFILEEEAPAGIDSIRISYPCSEEIVSATSSEGAGSKTVNGVEVRYFIDDDGLYYQCYLDPTMTVGIRTLFKNQEIREEANKIVDSLKVKQAY